MDLSFKEKSAWISFVSTLLIFGYYFYQLLHLRELPEVQALQVANELLFKTIVMSIIVETVFHSMLAATNRRAAEMGGDERDELFELKANNYGYWVLGVGVVGAIVHLQMQVNMPDFEPITHSLALPSPTAHILLFVFILSELVRFGSRIVIYRRGY